MKGYGHKQSTLSLCGLILGVFSFQGSVHAACIVPVTSTTMSHFLRSPEGLLISQGTKNDSLVWRVRTFAAASFASLKALEKLPPKANLVQKIAIGEGLARAHSACSARDGEVSHRIDDAVRKIADRDLTRAYLRFLTGGEDKNSLIPPQKEDDALRRNSLGFDETIKLQRNMPSGGIKFK